jgi:hypothetical protein
VNTAGLVGFGMFVVGTGVGGDVGAALVDAVVAVVVVVVEEVLGWSLCSLPHATVRAPLAAIVTRAAQPAA